MNPDIGDSTGPALWFRDAGPPDGVAGHVHYSVNRQLHAIAITTIDYLFEYDDSIPELRAALGASVISMSYALASNGVALPKELERIGVATDYAAQDFPAPLLNLMIIDGVSHLALTWPYGRLVAATAIIGSDCVAALAPAREIATKYVRLERGEEGFPGSSYLRWG